MGGDDISTFIGNVDVFFTDHTFDVVVVVASVTENSTPAASMSC